MSSNGANIPYLGSKISLISKAKIRYEGILYTIDPQESTVALAKVRSYGTENRPVENPLPPKDEVYEYIIFRAADIEDLQVSEPPRPTALHETIPHADPAIVQHAPPSYINSQAQQQMVNAPVGPRAAPAAFRPSQDMSIQAGGRTYDGSRRRVRTVAPPNIFRQNVMPPNRGMFRRPRGRNVSFGALPTMNRSPRVRNRSVGGSSLKFDGDFDFEKANEEFSKFAEQMSSVDIKDQEGVPAAKTTEQMRDKTAEAENAPGDNESHKENVAHQEDQQPERFYDRSKSFFDKISCEALEREKGEESRIRKSWREERDQNAETFGDPVNWSRFNKRYGMGGNRQLRRGGGIGPGNRYPGSFRRVPFYNQQHLAGAGDYHDGSRATMEQAPLPTWYSDYPPPPPAAAASMTATTLASYPRMSHNNNMSMVQQRRGPLARNHPTVYGGPPRRYPVYG